MTITKLNVIVGARFRCLDFFRWLAHHSSPWAIILAEEGLMLKLRSVIRWIEGPGRKYKKDDDEDEDDEDDEGEGAPTPPEEFKEICKAVIKLFQDNTDYFKVGYLRSWGLHVITHDHAPTPAPAGEPRWEMPDVVVGQLAGVFNIYIDKSVDPEGKLPFQVKIDDYDLDAGVAMFQGLLTHADVQTYMLQNDTRWN